MSLQPRQNLRMPLFIILCSNGVQEHIKRELDKKYANPADSGPGGRPIHRPSHRSFVAPYFPVSPWSPRRIVLRDDFDEAPT